LVVVAGVTPGFIATERFGPDDGQAWSSYIGWSGLTQLREVVSLDEMLCPTLLPEIQDDYWPHIVNDNFSLHYFLDFDFLMKQVSGIEKKNLLCVFRSPGERPVAPAIARFEFLGYDLVDLEGTVSALTNCGGFPGVFENAELSSCGLLPQLERAIEVQTALRSLYPGERHAHCAVWALFRWVGD
jgi:hypothetical protein